MARFYAQLCTLVFAVLVVVGAILGNAVPVATGQAGGNLGSITLHMTWVRDGLDLILLVAFVYIGFFATRSAGRIVMLAAGLVLFALGVVGFINGDNDQASRGLAGLNFPVVMNLFDLTTGVLGLLAGLGTLGDADIPQQSIIRPGTVVPDSAKK